MSISLRLIRMMDRWATSTPAASLGRALQDTANLILPTCCAICSAPDERLCPECRERLRAQLRMPPVPEHLCPSLDVADLGHPLTVMAAGSYANELSRAVLAFKDHQRFFLAALFAPYLAALLNEAAQQRPLHRRILLVPIPSSPLALGRRGYRPVPVMLQTAMQNRQLDQRLRVRPVLQYRWDQLLSGAQKGRTGAARRTGQVGLKAQPPSVRQQPILLVDDVMTTGATLQNAALTCHDAGYEVLGGVVLALTRPPGSDADPGLR